MSRTPRPRPQFYDGWAIRNSYRYQDNQDRRPYLMGGYAFRETVGEPTPGPAPVLRTRVFGTRAAARAALARLRAEAEGNHWLIGYYRHCAVIRVKVGVEALD